MVKLTKGILFMIIKERLALLREGLGLSKKEFAEKLNVEQSTYGKYELGKRQPSLEILLRITELFDVSADYLLGLSDIHKPFITGIESESINKKSLNDVINITNELSEQSKTDLLKHAELLKLRDRAGLIETATEFYIKPVEG